MNKLMCAIGAAAIAGIAMADVQSANIVGYNQVFVKGGKMNLLTVSFEKVGIEKVFLNDVMESKELCGYDSGTDKMRDYIDTWDMESGDWGNTLYYINDPEQNWYDDDGNLIDYTDTWMTADWMPLNPEMVSGSSFWLYHDGEDIEGLNFAGQVTCTTKSYTLTGGKMNLCGNPYPSMLDLRKTSGQVVITGATGYDSATDSMNDYIDTWDLTTADWGATYYYINDPEQNWYDDDGNLVDYTDTWMTADWMPSSTSIQAGAGFWYYAAKPGVTLTFTQL